MTSQRVEGLSPSNPHPSRVHLTVRSGDLDDGGDTVSVLLDLGHGVAEVDVDPVEAVEAAEQLAVDERLVEAVLARPAEGMDLRVVVEDDLALRGHEPHDVRRPGQGLDLLGEPDGLDQAERLVVEADRAGIVDEVVTGLEEHRPAAVEAEQVREHEPDGAGADDDDLGLHDVTAEGVRGGGSVLRPRHLGGRGVRAHA
jgi:hypothetical protein